MRARFSVCAAALILAAGAAHAASEGVERSVYVVSEKIDRETHGASVADLLRLEEDRRAEAEKKVEAIRNLPPACVQDWISGRLSEAAPFRLAPEPRAQAQAAAGAVPVSRLYRLLLVSVTVLIFAGLLGLQRRREQAADAKARERPQPKPAACPTPAGQPHGGRDDFGRKRLALEEDWHDDMIGP